MFAQGRRLTGEGLNDYSLSSIYRDALEAAEAVAGGVDPPAEGGALRSLLDGRHQKTQAGTMEKGTLIYISFHRYCGERLEGFV